MVINNDKIVSCSVIFVKGQTFLTNILKTDFLKRFEQKSEINKNEYYEEIL